MLRTPLDSVQELRVTTTGYGADQGRSSGAQVSLVTRSGTNVYRGATYWAHRNTATSTVPYFVGLSQRDAGLTPEPPKLNKHIFGGALGGPVRRDRLFFFGNFEGTKEISESPVTRAVPSMAMRDGVLIYQCAVAEACPGGAAQGFSRTHAVPAGFHGLTPADTARIDPLGIGPSVAASQYWSQFPVPNDPGRDGRNLVGYRFNAPIDNVFRTVVARMDARATATQSIFGRINVQRDAVVAPPQFPGQGSAATASVKNWGLAIGHDWMMRANVVGSLRYGYTRLDTDVAGRLAGNTSSFRFLDNFAPTTSSNGREMDTHHLVADVSWSLGRHLLKAGANVRFTRNDRYTNATSWHVSSTNSSWLSGVGRLYMPGGECPAPADCSGLPDVAGGDQATFADGMSALLGVLSQTDAIYNYRIDGSRLPQGEAIRRVYGADEYEGYVQDTWRVGDRLTISGGLRYGLFSPPYEANGAQVAPNVSLGEWFATRERNMMAGIPSHASERISLVPSGPRNGGRGFYAWDKNNFAPRLSVAWTPTPRDVVRGGYSIVHDRIGQGLATTFDAIGSFGLTTTIQSPFALPYELDPAVRFAGVDTIPESALPEAPAGGFPATPEVGLHQIAESLDDTIVTPYAHVITAAYGRDLGNGFGLDVAYVGRRGRNQLVRRDLAMPLNFTDTASGVDYFTAARQLLDATAGIAPGAPPSAYGSVAPIAYWENLFPGAAGGGFSATQVMAMSFNGYRPDFISALYEADLLCVPACSIYGPYTFFSEQYASLAAVSSIGRSAYDALQISLRKRLRHGYQFDVNYTYARAKDHASSVESGSAFGNTLDGGGGYSGFLVNSWEPDRQYSYSDYDIRHQLNMHGIAELPFGRGRRWGRSMPGWVNVLAGDWGVAGIWRMTSGLPMNVINCRSCWPTNWSVQGNAELVTPGRLPATGVVRDAIDGRPSAFVDPADALTYFRHAYPGEVGIRNVLRGDGYFNIDFSLSKAWSLPLTNHRLRFRWDTFNLTNAVRFDPKLVSTFPDVASTFGRYEGTFDSCGGAAGRCMQFTLRYEF